MTTLKEPRFEPICIFCGDWPRIGDDFTTMRPTVGEKAFGWHPEHWPPKAVNLSDIVLRHTPRGIRGRLRSLLQEDQVGAPAGQE